ncbi:unnamed protein product [marine sediment metagenome]|uniref:Uncharacterized protein n=1 Tax=marine sediment metagenome TaxID=412755 RepID=X0V534_9ZZZZ
MNKKIQKRMQEFDEKFNRTGYIDQKCTNYVVQENSDKLKQFLQESMEQILEKDRKQNSLNNNQIKEIQGFINKAQEWLNGYCNGG